MRHIWITEQPEEDSKPFVICAKHGVQRAGNIICRKCGQLYPWNGAPDACDCKSKLEDTGWPLCESCGVEIEKGFEA